MLAIDKYDFDLKSRVAHVALLNLNLRLMENWRAAQVQSAREMLDYESLMIVMAVIVISAEKALRCESDAQDLSLRNKLPPEKIGRVNLSSLAAATGINRETVRRKVNKLQETGWLLRDKRDIRTITGAISPDVIHDVILTQLEAVTGTVNRLHRAGVLMVADQHS